MELEKSFAAEPASIRQARCFVVDALANVGADTETVKLLTSELATNAVVHAQTEFRVRVRAGDERVRVEIINDEPELLLAMREPSERGGYGLRLVKSLSTDWGAESHRDEKVVWFEVAARTGMLRWTDEHPILQ